MPILQWIISSLWLLFIVYWLISAFGVKRNLDANRWWRQGAVRLVLLIPVALALRASGVRHFLRTTHSYQANNLLLGAIGTLLVVAGIALAIYARVYLGRNWGTPMSRKENPDLITGGPYAYVRHPIYSGIMLAMLGSAIAQSIVWAPLLILFTPYFIYSARREEAFMRSQFPESYPAYMQRTKMLAPFVF